MAQFNMTCLAKLVTPPNTEWRENLECAVAQGGIEVSALWLSAFLMILRQVTRSVGPRSLRGRLFILNFAYHT